MIKAPRRSCGAGPCCVKLVRGGIEMCIRDSADAALAHLALQLAARQQGRDRVDDDDVDVYKRQPFILSVATTPVTESGTVWT